MRRLLARFRRHVHDETCGAVRLMLIRLIHAVAIGFIVGLVCLFLAAVLPAIHVPVITSIGGFLGDWAWPIGIVAGLLDFVSGGFGPSFGARA